MIIGDLVVFNGTESNLIGDFNITDGLAVDAIMTKIGSVSQVESDHCLVDYNVAGGLSTFLLPKDMLMYPAPNAQSAPVAPAKLQEIVTKDNLKEYLEDDDREFVENLIGRALWSLFERQEADEKSAEATTHANARGFSSYDAQYGSITAKYYKKYGHLGCNHSGNKEAWRANKWLKLANNGYPRLCKYARQLNEIANEKLS